MFLQNTDDLHLRKTVIVSFVQSFPLGRTLVSYGGIIGGHGKMPKHLKPEKRAALLKESQENTSKGGLAQGGARRLAEVLNPKNTDFLVREIVAYNVTKIFHAPVIWPDEIENPWPIENDNPWIRIPVGIPNYWATLTGDVRNYLELESETGPLVQNSGFYEKVEDLEKHSGPDSTSLVVEEQGHITECKMDRGECWYGPKEGPGEVVIIKYNGGAWPTFTEQTEWDNKLLASMRAMTKADHPFELYAKRVSYLTDKGEAAFSMPSMEFSATELVLENRTGC